MEIENDEDANMLQYLLINCYSKEEYLENVISTCILCGRNCKSSQDRPDTIIQRCNCEARSMPFEQIIHFVWPGLLIDSSEAAVEKLDDLVSYDLFIEAPEVIKDGTHHVYIQNNTIDSYKTISKENKSVLKYLRYFGLFSIHFRETQPCYLKKAGDIEITKVVGDEQNQIIQGLLFGENNNSAVIEMRFPHTIGSLITEAIGTIWTIEKIKTLTERVIN